MGEPLVISHENGVPKALIGLLFWLLIGLSLLLVVALSGNASWIESIVVLVLCLNLIGTVISIVKILRFRPHRIYLPITCYLVSVGIYHGVGPLLFIVANTDASAGVQGFFQVGLPELLNVLLLVQVCQIGVLSGYLGWAALLGPALSQRLSLVPKGSSRIDVLMVLIAIWGLLIKYFIQLPSDLHLTEKISSGVLINTGYFSYAALFYFWSECGSRRINKFWPVLLLILDIGFGVILLSKTHMILPVIAALMGSHLANPLRLRQWAIGGLGGLLFLGVLQPLNAYLRIRRSQGEAVSVFDAARGLSDLISMESLEDLRMMQGAGELGTSGQSRLSYVDTIAYGIHEYDSGRPWDSYHHFRYFLVPRFMWPDKPKVEPGLDFTRRIIGHENSYTGITLFGEAYFDLGWGGVMALSVWLPLMLFVLEIPSRLVTERGRVEQIIPLFYALFIGLRIDDNAVHLVTMFLQTLFIIPILAIILNSKKIRVAQ